MTATVLTFPMRKPSRHARGEGIRNARRFNELHSRIVAEVALTSELAEHLESELAKLFPAKADADRVRESF